MDTKPRPAAPPMTTNPTSPINQEPKLPQEIKY
jgi:hypothetical protein